MAMSLLKDGEVYFEICPKHNVVATFKWCAVHKIFHRLCCWTSNCKTPWDLMDGSSERRLKYD